MDVVVGLVTGIIATASVGHAAAGRHAFMQYSMPANYPLCLWGEPPCSKLQTPSVAELLSAVAGPRAARETAALARLLTALTPPLVPEPSARQLWDPACVAAEEELREEVRLVSENRALLNRTAEFPYRSLCAGEETHNLWG